MKKAYDLIATVCGLGRLPFAPGTWGSLAGLGLCLVLHGYIILYIAVFAVLFAAGVVSASKFEDTDGRKDPPQVVIDEFACIFLVFLLVPLKTPIILTGFILYRLIDIFKIPPMRSLERLKGGWGIMLDDLAAGIYANLILQILLFYKIF
jgi:phosphatidylglycerophosphatase A